MIIPIVALLITAAGAAVALTRKPSAPDNGVAARGSTKTTGRRRLRGRRAVVSESFKRIFAAEQFDGLQYDKKMQHDWEVFFPRNKLPATETFASKVGKFPRSIYRVTASLEINVGTNPRDPNHIYSCGTYYYDFHTTPDTPVLLTAPRAAVGTTTGGYCYTAPEPPFIGLIADHDDWIVWLVVSRRAETGRFTLEGHIDGLVLSVA